VRGCNVILPDTMWLLQGRLAPELFVPWLCGAALRGRAAARGGEQLPHRQRGSLLGGESPLDVCHPFSAGVVEHKDIQSECVLNGSVLDMVTNAHCKTN